MQRARPSSERIDDVWGERAPFGRGEAWPQRVDEFFVDETRPEDVERWVQSACVLCSYGCGVDIAVKGGKIVGVRGRAEDHVNHGRLGPKGLYGWQAINSPDRLTRPLILRTLCIFVSSPYGLTVRRNVNKRPATGDRPKVSIQRFGTSCSSRRAFVRGGPSPHRIRRRGELPRPAEAPLEIGHIRQRRRGAPATRRH